MIKIEALSKVYKLQDIEIVALKNIDLTISKGEIWGIIGPSHAGKTTLLRIMNGNEVPTEGKIWLEKENEAVLYSEQVKNKKVVTMFQDFPILWSKTLGQNLALLYEIQGVQKQSIRRKVQNILKLVQLEGMENCYLAQLDGENKQKAALACILIYRPEVLLCDETRFRIDPSRKEAVFNLIGHIQERNHLTLVYFTYDMNFVRKYCTHVAVLEHGQIIEQGKVSDIFQNPEKKLTKCLIKATN